MIYSIDKPFFHGTITVLNRDRHEYCDTLYHAQQLKRRVMYLRLDYLYALQIMDSQMWPNRYCMNSNSINLIFRYK